MNSCRKNTKRSSAGNMLFVVSSVAFLLLAVMMFGLFYLSTTKGNLEQKTAAEAAALAVAQDIGRIVVNTPECGNVGFCDHAPQGKGTIADDNWFGEVRSINELMATARLNYIIGSQLGDTQLKKLAIQDRDNIIAAKDKLLDAVREALKPGGKAKDINGDEIRPFEDAEAIYLKNNAKNSSYVPGSLKIEIGGLEGGIATQISLPTPNSKAGINAGDSMDGCYVSDINLPIAGENFVFASTGKRVALGDLSKYRAAVPGLPFQMSAVVKVDADQKFTEQGKTSVQHFSACASPGNDHQHPVGGALTISFPDGPVPELNCPKDLLQWAQMQNAHCEVLSCDGGDFPVDPEANIGAPGWQSPDWISSPPSASDVSRLGLFDWIRAAGSRVNIDSVLNMQSGEFDPPQQATITWRAIDPFTLLEINLGQVPQGIMHIYTFSADGTVLYRSKTIKPFPYTIVSNQQMYAELQEGQELKSAVPIWKVEGISFSRQSYLPFPGTNSICQFPCRYASESYWQNTGPNLRSGLLSLLPEASEVGGGKGGSSKGGPNGDGDYKGGDGKGKAKYSTEISDIEGTQSFDFYFRDMVRQGGAELGGIHQGEPMDNPLVSFRAKPSFWSKQNGKIEHLEIGGGKPTGGGGSGAPPIISRQDDFATNSIPTPPYRGYSYGPDSGAPRPTYIKNGVCVDIRFRRQVKVGSLSVLLGGADVGYIGEML